MQNCYFRSHFSQAFNCIYFISKLLKKSILKSYCMSDLNSISFSFNEFSINLNNIGLNGNKSVNG
jgi:hypothetical protein